MNKQPWRRVSMKSVLYRVASQLLVLIALALIGTILAALVIFSW
jgi:hypothetical protein